MGCAQMHAQTLGEWWQLLEAQHEADDELTRMRPEGDFPEWTG